MVRLYSGDALRVLRELPDDTVDAVITDPPYNSGGRSSRERTKDSSRQKYVSADARHKLPAFAGDNRDQRSYVLWLSLVLGECYRIARSGAHALVFSDWRQLPSTIDAVQVAGWIWQGTLVWHKPNSRPRKGGFRQAEFVVWASKGPYVRHDVYLPGMFSVSQPSGRRRRHITQKPVGGLLSDLVRICPPGGVVLDPFMGSGSTGVAAVEHGLDFIGVDLAEANLAVARDRLSVSTTHRL